MPAKINKRKVLPKKKEYLPKKVMFVFGAFCVLLGLFLIIQEYLPIVSHEIKYSVRQITKQNLSKVSNIPKDTTLGILIPKIGANSSIIPNVDPNNSTIYQYALTKGVAHAKGTATPGSLGNSFLFSHSSEDVLNANRYNSIFYLLNKLTVGDEIWIYVNSVKYVYIVDSTKIVQATDVSYLNPVSTKKQLTLMTCWPPGTNLKRSLVIATVKE